MRDLVTLKAAAVQGDEAEVKQLQQWVALPPMFVIPTHDPFEDILLMARGRDLHNQAGGPQHRKLR